MKGKKIILQPTFNSDSPQKNENIVKTFAKKEIISIVVKSLHFHVPNLFTDLSTCEVCNEEMRFVDSIEGSIISFSIVL